MRIPTIILGITAVVAFSFACLRGNNLHILGLKTGGKMLIDVLPMVLLAFAIAGLIQVLIPKEFIASWLSAKAGFKGIIIGSLAGAITPSGGPFIVYPIAVSLYRAGAGMGTVIAYIMGHMSWGIAGIPFSLALLGPRIFLAKFVSCFFVPILVGIVAQVIFH